MITAFLEINMFPNEIIRNVGKNYVCKTLSQKKKKKHKQPKCSPIKTLLLELLCGSVWVHQVFYGLN